MVVLDAEGVIKGSKVIHHDEPILLIGIPEQKMHDFTDQYAGLKADQRVTVGGKSSERRVAVDGLSGATVTVMVINEDRKSTRLNSSHVRISYAGFCSKQ